MIRPLLCFFSVLRPRAGIGFEPRKLKNKQRKIFFKKRLFMEFSFNRNNNYKGLVTLSINLLIIFYFTLCLVFLLLINKIYQIFVMFDVHITCRVNFVF
jgi:hypothetical protein